MTLDPATAAALAAIALRNVVREYPNHPGHAFESAADVRTPRALHPAFYGSYDWHSCVHMHWLLARVRRLHPGAHEAAIAAVFDAHLDAAAIAGEAAYFDRPGARAFERMYGWGWLLLLAAELQRAAAAGDVRAGGWQAALQPLSDVVVARYHAFLPRARYPIRYGVHANSAFGLACALDYAAVAGAAALGEAVGASAMAWFGDDAHLPAAWEPSGADFFSPSLIEADLMRRVLAPADFAGWLARALPSLADAQPPTLFEPAQVSDRADPQIVHLDGLNLSRAWCLRGIAGGLPADDVRRAVLIDAAERHLAAGMAGLRSDDYCGAHWLATFALRALTA
jgi:hypothetical protein